MNPKELGRQVFLKRKEKGWSQEKLGDMAGISRNYVSQIERGEAESISIKVINKLAIALEIPPADFGEPESPANVMIPPALREFALQKNLSFEDTEVILNIPRRGREPKTVEEWQHLYDLISKYLNHENNDKQ